MKSNESELMEDVDRDPGVHQATEPDEETVLADLYGLPDGDGIYRGEGS